MIVMASRTDGKHRYSRIRNRRSLPMPFSSAWCTMLTGSRSRARASVKRPLSITSLTTTLPADLMTTSTREHPYEVAGIIGMPGRLQSVQAAAFARNPRPILSECAGTWFLMYSIQTSSVTLPLLATK